jgi:hypothetical protein
MKKDRLEAFSDGVIAILITIMVLELRVPHGTDWDALRPLLPVFLTYVLRFILAPGLTRRLGPSQIKSAEWRRVQPLVRCLQLHQCTA